MLKNLDGLYLTQYSPQCHPASEVIHLSGQNNLSYHQAVLFELSEELLFVDVSQLVLLRVPVSSNRTAPGCWMMQDIGCSPRAQTLRGERLRPLARPSQIRCKL
jgi:hypothetical protein